MKKATHKGIYLKLNEDTDKDILERLDKQENKQGYIKELIRTDYHLDCLRDAFNNGLCHAKPTKEGDK